MIDRTKFHPADCLTGMDTPIPIDEYRSVPTERMVELLAGMLATTGSVLEFGTGSGYQTAVLAERCERVLSVEINPVAGVAEKLPANVTLVEGDAALFQSGEQYDGVLVTFAAPRILPNWYEQVKEGGRLVVPIRQGRSCRICCYQKIDGVLQLQEVAAYAPFTEQVQAQGVK